MDFINALSPKILVTRGSRDLAQLDEQVLILGTDEVGTVTVASDGNKLRI